MTGYLMLLMVMKISEELAAHWWSCKEFSRFRTWLQLIRFSRIPASEVYSEGCKMKFRLSRFCSQVALQRCCHIKTWQMFSADDRYAFEPGKETCSGHRHRLTSRSLPLFKLTILVQSMAVTSVSAKLSIAKIASDDAYEGSNALRPALASEPHFVDQNVFFVYCI